MSNPTGVLALVGGGEWSPGCDFDLELLSAGGGEVLVLPTAKAYEQPALAVEQAESWFDSLGAKATPLFVMSRSDAEDPANAGAVARARFVYLSDGSALHLRSVLKGSKVMDAMRSAWQSGAVVAGSGAAAMVLTDPMVDPRGGALTVGLGLIGQMAFIAGHRSHEGAAEHRTIAMAPPDLPVAGAARGCALIRSPLGKWASHGPGPVEVYLNAKKVGLDVLP